MRVRASEEESRPEPEPEPEPGHVVRLVRVVGPEPGVFRLSPEPEVFAADPALEGPGGAGPPAVVPDTGAGRRALAAFDPGRRAVRALAVLAVAVALVVGFVVWRARPRVEPVVAAPVPIVSDTPPSSAPIVVSVVGRVQRPGLVRLAPGSRVADAIEAAGGVQAGTDLGYLNLARKVVDGELLAVGVTPPPGAGPPVGSAPGGLINLNTASAAELDTLPGVGPVLAQRIVEYRTRAGGFRSVADLRKVEGVGAARLEQLKGLVTV